MLRMSRRHRKPSDLTSINSYERIAISLYRNLGTEDMQDRRGDKNE